MEPIKYGSYITVKHFWTLFNSECPFWPKTSVPFLTICSNFILKCGPAVRTAIYSKQPKKKPTQNPILSLNIQAFIAYRKLSLSCKDVKLQRQQETAAGWIMNLCCQSCSPPRLTLPVLTSHSLFIWVQTWTNGKSSISWTRGNSLILLPPHLCGVSVWIGGPPEPRARADELRGF